MFVVLIGLIVLFDIICCEFGVIISVFFVFNVMIIRGIWKLVIVCNFFLIDWVLVRNCNFFFENFIIFVKLMVCMIVVCNFCGFDYIFLCRLGLKLIYFFIFFICVIVVKVELWFGWLVKVIE